MTDRLESLLSAGMLSPHPAPDEELTGLWANVIKAYRDARTDGLSAEGRVIRAYDAVRLAAHTLVRSRNLRARAQNHHEVTITAGAIIGGEAFERELRHLNDLRRLRNTLEYGWEEATDYDADEAAETAGRLLLVAATALRGNRPDLTFADPD